MQEAWGTGMGHRTAASLNVNQYSFVLIDPQGMHSHLRIAEFENVEQASQLAEAVVSELSIDPDHRWAGWKLEVRDVHGQLVITKIVPATELASSRIH